MTARLNAFRDAVGQAGVIGLILISIVLPAVVGALAAIVASLGNPGSAAISE